MIASFFNYKYKKISLNFFKEKKFVRLKKRQLWQKVLCNKKLSDLHKT